MLIHVIASKGNGRTCRKKGIPINDTKNVEDKITQYIWSVSEEPSIVREGGEAVYKQRCKANTRQPSQRYITVRWTLKGAISSLSVQGRKPNRDYPVIAITEPGFPCSSKSPSAVHAKKRVRLSR